MKFNILALSACAMISFSTLADEHKPHWSYAGKEHPGKWAKLDSSFETCAKGGTQSPINIHGAIKADLPALQPQYGPTKGTVINNGHTIQVNLEPGQKLKVGTSEYELLQFHFHTPSEEAVDGKRSAMVAHFVHKSTTGELGVIAVLLKPGNANSAFAPVFSQLPRTEKTPAVSGLDLDLAAMLPSNLAYYSFAGSLTTPPCSEGVNWMVLKNPVSLSTQQIKAFRQVFNANARPLQPLNGRVIKASE